MVTGQFLFDDPIEGEAIPFDPFIVVPIGGLGVSSIFRNISKSFDDFYRTFVSTAKPTVSTTIASSSSGVTRTISKGLADARSRMGVSIPTVSGGTKALIGTGIVGTTASVGILSLTEGGQNVVATTRDISKDVSGFGQGVTQFFQSNPLLLAGIIIVTGIVVLKK